jgi:predicted phosphate transport protein (TIGR00153 family)
MAILTNLFGESPFGILEEHGEKVHECVRLLQNLFDEFKAGNVDALRATAERIFTLESEADTLRNQLHEMLVSKILMPLPKSDFYNILEQQDSMADRAEDVAALLTLRDMSLPAELTKEVADYLAVVLGNCNLAAGIMSKLDLLVENSFSGRDAQTVSKLITELAEREDAVKPLQIALSRKLLATGDQIPAVESVLWLQIINRLAELSKFADKTGNGIRMTLQLKSSK